MQENPLNLYGEELERWKQFSSKSNVEEQEKYQYWLLLVNYDLEQTIGVGLDDIEDMPYRDWFNDGIEYIEAVNKILDRLNE